MERVDPHPSRFASSYLSHASSNLQEKLVLERRSGAMEIYERRSYPHETLRAPRGNRDDERDDPTLRTRRDEASQWQRSDLRNPPVPMHESSIIRLPIAVGQRQLDRELWRRGSTVWYNATAPERNATRVNLVGAGGRMHPVGMVPLVREESSSTKQHQHRTSTFSNYTLVSTNTSSTTASSDPAWSRRYNAPQSVRHHQRVSSSRGRGSHQSVSPPVVSSRVIIPSNIVIPTALSPESSTGVESSVETPEDSKRSTSDSWQSSPSSTPSFKRQKTGTQDATFDKLDLLCAATLDLGPLSENPAGCSCPKSKCIALYCDCFKAGRRCSPTACTCLNCKNTIEESGPNGARSKAIHAILTRNPRAFTNAGNGNPAGKLKPGEQACNCIRSQCLKLYCTCFQGGKVCDPEICTCVACLNTAEDIGGKRRMAISSTLEKRPDAFNEKKAKEIGAGCACKNNKCIRKYCECFRTSLACTPACSCRDCQNQEVRR